MRSIHNQPLSASNTVRNVNSLTVHDKRLNIDESKSAISNGTHTLLDNCQASYSSETSDLKLQEHNSGTVTADVDSSSRSRPPNNTSNSVRDF